MEKIVAVTNEGKEPIYIGSLMVVPGDTRHFPIEQVPEHLRPKEAPPATDPVPSGEPPADPIAAAFSCKSEELVATITSLTAIPAMVPIEQLIESRDKVIELIEVERASPTPRTHVLDALSSFQVAIGDALQTAYEAKDKVDAEAKAQADADAIAKAQAADAAAKPDAEAASKATKKK